MMVRNAFALADNIHMRAAVADCPSTDATDGSPAHSQVDGRGGLDNVQRMNEGEEDENIVEGGTIAEGGFASPAESGGSTESSSDSSGGESTDASDDLQSDAEDLEDLLGQIPNENMGSNPEFDIAATLPLYEGSTLSMLCATLLIVNCCKTHGVSNTFMNELLMLLSMSILPLGNCLPKTEYEASKILRRLGLTYNMIHACPSGCCLFKGDLEDADKCPVCDADRFRRCGRSKVPTLILRHFPLIPQLQRMFSSKKLSKLNVWHYFNKFVDGKMRHTADSP